MSFGKLLCFLLFIFLFITSSCKKEKPVTFAILTLPVTNITDSTAISGGNIMSDGGKKTYDRGICWGLDSLPTTLFDVTRSNSDSNKYTCKMSRLDHGVIYHVRAYMSNELGITYGADISFKTSYASIPTVQTNNSVSGITSTTAVIGGTVLTDGGTIVSHRGICWGTLPDPIETFPLATSRDSSGVGSFTHQLTKLYPNTTYHVRAYAENYAGTAYGEDISFTTLPPGIPALSTSKVNSIVLHSALCGGSIISDGSTSITDRGICWNSNPNPTVNDNFVSYKYDSIAFSCYMAGLNSNTAYYVRAYATNKYGTAYGNEITFNTQQESSTTVSDYDGNTYHTVIIGNQEWMVENLKTTHYSDGSAIPFISDSTNWGKSSTAAYSWYKNDISYKDSYGAFYNWYAVNTKKLCPTGWHVPNDDELTSLFTYLGGKKYACRLMEAGITHWVSPNTGADNSTGFTGLPTGKIDILYIGVNQYYFRGFGFIGEFWSTTGYSATQHADDLDLEQDFTSTSYSFLYFHDWKVGLTVRCLKN